MPSQPIYDTETVFLEELYKQLKLITPFRLEKAPAAGRADLLVVDPASGKQMIIEIKGARDYGELPNSTILPMAELAHSDKYEKIILVSFSRVSDFLSTKLKEINVEALTKPTVNQVVEQVQLALSA